MQQNNLRAHQVQEALIGNADKLMSMMMTRDFNIEQPKDLFRKISAGISVAQKFLLTDNIPFPADNQNFSPIPETAHLPADVCYFERSKGPMVTAMFCAPVDEDVVAKDFSGEGLSLKWVCFLFFKMEGSSSWAMSPYWAAVGITADDQIKVTSRMVLPCKVNAALKEQLEGATRAACSEVIFFLQMLSCSNVSMTKIPRPDALNKKRKKRNLPVLDSYHILNLPLVGKPQYEEADLGGHHKSPRYHFRRGHVRRLAPDQITWVANCMVGNPELGSVEKSYRA